MWLIPELSSGYVSIIFSEAAVICCWFEHRKNKQILLRAYQRYDCHRLEVCNGALYNAIDIGHCIRSFLKKYAIKNPFVTIALQGSFIVQEYKTFGISSPSRKDFNIVDSFSFVWGYEYIYQNSDGQFVFYLYKVPQFLLLQYKLLAVSCSLNVIAISTSDAALFQCYKFLMGEAFRYSEFGVLMESSGNEINKLITVEMVTNRCEISSMILIEKELLCIAQGCGLLVSQERI